MPNDRSLPTESNIPVSGAELYCRTIGIGQSIIVLHGGPDFDHTYLLPELDQLSDSHRLIFYDQRGRGKSAEKLQPEKVNMESEVEDLDTLREHFQLGSVSLIGHSWGALLALEYAIRFPARVSHLILMNSAPVSHKDYLLLRQERLKKSPADIAELKERFSTPEYQSADPEAVADYYRVHFRAAFRQLEHHEQIINRLRASFTQEGVRKARAVEKQLMKETWLWNDYDLFPQLRELHIPTLILHGDHDFIPLDCALHIRDAIQDSHLVVLKDCGHFSYLECPAELRKEIDEFLRSSRDRNDLFG